MAVDIFLDPITNDISLNGNFTMRLTANVEESSRQQVQISLSTFKGELFSDIDAGIPYVKNNNNEVNALGERSKRFIDTLIQADILARENIVRIVSYESTLDKAAGQLDVKAMALTNTGEVIPVVVTT